MKTKKILAMLLSLAMIFAFAAVPAFADEEESGQVITMTGEELLAEAKNGIITLDSDITLTTPVVVPEGTTLSFNLGGFTMTFNNDAMAEELIQGTMNPCILNNGTIDKIENGTITSSMKNAGTILNNAEIKELANDLVIVSAAWGSTAVYNKGNIKTVSAEIVATNGGTSTNNTHALYNVKDATIEKIYKAVIYTDSTNCTALLNTGNIDLIDDCHIYATNSSLLFYNHAIENGGSGKIGAIQNSLIESYAPFQSNGRCDTNVIWNNGATISKIENCTVIGQYDGKGMADASAISSSGVIGSLTGTKFFCAVGGATKYISGGYFDVAPDFGIRVENYVAKELETPITDEKGNVYNYEVVYDKEAYEAEKVATSVASVTFADGTTNMFASIIDAISAVKTGSTLTLLADVTTTSALTFKNVKNVTFELNGHVLNNTVGGTYAILFNAADLTIKDSSESGTGKIACNGGANMGFYIAGVATNTGILTLESGTLEGMWTIGTQGVCYINIKGGRVVSSTGSHHPIRVCSLSSGSAKINITGGFIENSNTSFGIFLLLDGYDKSNISITGGTFNCNPTGYVDTERCTVTTDESGKLYTVTKNVIESPEIVIDETEAENAELKDENGNVMSEEAAAEVRNAIVAIATGNDAVNSFTGTGINEAVKADESTIIAALKAQATSQQIQNVDEQLTSETELDSNINVNLKSAVVSKANNVVLSKEMTFDVTPVVTTFLKNGDIMEKVSVELHGIKLKKPLTFRLPVDPGVENGTIAEIYHENDETPIARVPVQSDGNDKFLEVTNDEFSFYSYKLTGEVDWAYDFDSAKYTDSDGNIKGVVRFLFDSGIESEYVQMSKVLFYGKTAEKGDSSKYEVASDTGIGYEAFSADLYNLDAERTDALYAVGVIQVEGNTIWSDVQRYVPDFKKVLDNYEINE